VTVLAQLLATLAVAVLQWYAARRDIRETERGRMALEAARLGAAALTWKADHPLPTGPDADLDHQLVVRDDAGTLHLPIDRPPAP
jgi:hypothetical protein